MKARASKRAKTDGSLLALVDERQQRHQNVRAIVKESESIVLHKVPREDHTIYAPSAMDSKDDQNDSDMAPSKCTNDTENNGEGYWSGDDDVEVVVSTVDKRGLPNSTPSCGVPANSFQVVAQSDDIEEVELTKSTLTNPCISYPHARHTCGVYPFHTNPTLQSSENELHCPECYCFVCDKRVEECKQWKNSHCHAHSGDSWWNTLRHEVRKAKGQPFATICQNSANAQRVDLHEIGQNEVIALDSDDEELVAAGDLAAKAFFHVAPLSHDDCINLVNEDVQMRYSHQYSDRIVDMGSLEVIDQECHKIHHPYYKSSNVFSPLKKDHATQQQDGATKNRKDARITDILKENLKSIMKLSIANDSSSPIRTDMVRRKMEGDIPQLRLHNSFFIEGVRVGWPFPIIMPPQRQMALHLIKAFKSSRHVVLESPTGTGKSAAILCTALAWQRYHAKTARLARKSAAKTGREHIVDDGNKAGEAVKIIYCSRTHSQVSQMVSSLKETPYRPRMAILGSRERLCIHRDLRPRKGNKETPKSLNVNNECHTRVSNTEKYRKSLHRSISDFYDDDMPPAHWPGDGGGNVSDLIDSSNSLPQTNVDAEDLDILEVREFQSKTFKTCSHYRQLSTRTTAELAHAMFVPDKNRVDCCSLGGKKTKMGTHDIEDLVSFGVNPHVHKAIAIYRGSSEISQSIGIKLMSNKSNKDVVVASINSAGAAAAEGSLAVGDMIRSVNEEPASGLTLHQIVAEVKESDPVVFDIQRGLNTEYNDDGYSSHSACPYYLSRELAKDAEIIFAPYNYVLDPIVRLTLGIDIAGSIIVLDEAHNIEDTLRSGGSGKFGEFELCELVVMLLAYSAMEKSAFTRMDASEDILSVAWDDGVDSAMYLPDVAHSVLLFLEKVMLFLVDSKEKFESNLGPNGAAKAIEEYRRYRTPDDKEFEVTYFGPTGFGVSQEPIGCKPFFDKLGIQKNDCDTLVRYAEALERFVREKQKPERDMGANIVDRLVEFITKFTNAYQAPEHYYVASIVSANGNLDYASGDEHENVGGRQRSNRSFKRKPPKKLSLAPPRTVEHKNRLPNKCHHLSCKNYGGEGTFHATYHGTYCDGSTPKWEASIVLNLLSPGMLMEELSDRCRSVVLASGSLAPIESLCAELNLLPPESQEKANQLFGVTERKSEPICRLQLRPQPLEANHVISLEKQLLAVSIGHFPDGHPLTVTYSNYNKPGFFSKLGCAIAFVIEGIPQGGVLVFLPSYSFLKKCINAWHPDPEASFDDNVDGSVWQRFLDSKGKVVVETTGSQGDFENSRQEYNNTIQDTKKCILLAVYRGKMAEGVSFDNDFARGVVCVGIPLPSAFDRAIKAKKDYNNEQRMLRHRTKLLSGSDWYNQQAFRAIGQALGRCIRHAADYGTVILMDSRHCDDGAPSEGVCKAHRNLPKWMRHHVRNLTVATCSQGTNSVIGGYGGLAQVMKCFFDEARLHSLSVLEKHQNDLKEAQEREIKSGEHGFDAATGKWTIRETLTTCCTPTFPQTSSLPSSINKQGTTTVQSIPNSTPSVLTTASVSTPVSVINEETKILSQTVMGHPPPVFPPKSHQFQVPPSKISVYETQQTSTKQMFLQSSNFSTRNMAEEEMLCIICEVEHKNIVLLPCKHLCICSGCFSRSKVIDCPMCRTKIENSLKVFI